MTHELICLILVTVIGTGLYALGYWGTRLEDWVRSAFVWIGFALIIVAAIGLAIMVF